jgi:uncharacterized protein YkwD
MGAGASVNAASLSEEEAADALVRLYKEDPDKVERILSRFRGQPATAISTTLRKPAGPTAAGAEEGRGASTAQAVPRAEGNAPVAEPQPPEMTTPDEILAAINAVRASPASYIPHMQERLTRFDGKKLKSRAKTQPNMMTVEGPAAVEEVIRFLETAPPAPPLALSPELCQAAHDHLNDIAPKGLATHVGSDGVSMQVQADQSRLA